MKTPKKYSKEFKLDAVRLVLDQGYTRRVPAALCHDGGLLCG